MVPSDVAALGRDIAHALAHIHARNVVHRDVSPGNILLPRNALRDHGVAAKLTDLGIARVIDAGRITATGTLIGTAAYLSPEQVRGRSVSSASDVYSLGLVLLECLTGRRAFSGPATESAVARLSRDPDISDEVPANWRNVLTAMTSREPADRPTAAEVAQALTGTSRGSEPQAPTEVTMPLLSSMDSQSRRLTDPVGSEASATIPVRAARHPLHESLASRLRHVNVRWAVLAIVAGIALIAASIALFALPGAQKAAPEPHYPVIPGQLGTHLSQLEHAVSPQGSQ